MGAVAVDAPALFLQGTVLLVGMLGVLLIAERRIASRTEADEATGGLDAFTPQASAVPGSVAEQLATKAGVIADRGVPADDVRRRRHAAVPGRRRPADHVHRAGGAVAAAVPAVRAGAAATAAVAGSGAEILPARRLLVGVLPLRRRDAVRLRRHAGPRAASPTRRRPRIRHRHRWRWSASALLLVGVLFKVGAVPFHSWIPDVYQGAPTPITAFMAAATKIAAFGAMLRIFYVALPDLRDDWRPVLWAIAILTMVVGTVTAVTQTDVKRMLAYSAVAHAGFILTGVIAANRRGSVLDAVLPVRLRIQHARRVRRREPGARRRRRGGDRDVAVGRARPALSRLSAWCSRCSCSRSPAFR